MIDRGRDEGVFISLLCVGFAWACAVKYPSVGINLILMLMIGWFLWSIYRMTLDRM